MILRRMCVLVVLAAATLCSACDHDCNLMGCGIGLSVRLKGILPDTFTVEVLAEGHDPVALHCYPANRYYCFAVVHDFHPEEVTIRVSGATAYVEVTTRPEYDIYRPNGPDCGTECRSAEVVIDLTHRRRHLLPDED